MDKLIDLWKQSYITQTVIVAVVLVAWALYIIQHGQSQPDLDHMILLIVGYYFGLKSGLVANSIVASASAQN